MIFMKKTWWIILAGGLAVLAAGCTPAVTFQPGAADKTRFYVLAAAAGKKTPAATDGKIHLGLKTIELPDYLRAPMLAIRKGNNEIQFDEFNRWGGRLDTLIAEALAQDLLAQPGVKTVALAPWERAQQFDFLVKTRFDHFEGHRNGKVEMLARWQILSPADDSLLQSGVTTVNEDGWNGRNCAQLAEALGDALQKLAADIASAAGQIKNK
jgi:uncharacterized protein